MRSRKFLAAALATLTLTMVGCSGTKPSESKPDASKPAEGKPAAAGKIKVMTRAGSYYTKGTQAVAEEFTKKTGIQVEVAEIGRAGYFAELTTKFSGNDSDVDVAWLVSPNLPKYAAAGGLEPLDKYVADSKLTPADWDEKDILAKYQYDGKTYMYPINISVMYTYYRKDLVPKPPETWDEYLEVAKKNTKALNPSAQTQYGAVWPAKSPEELQRTFFTVVFSNGGTVYDDAKKTLGLDQPAAIGAGDTYVKFLKAGVVPKDIMSYAFTEIMDGLKAGKFAIAAPQWDTAIAQIRTSDSPYKDKIEVAPLPGFKMADGSIKRVSMQQGWGLVVNAKSKNKEAAYQFVNFISSKEGQKIIVEKVGGLNPSRKSLLNDPAFEGKPTSAHFKLHAQVLSEAVGMPAYPWFPDLEDKVGSALGEIMSGTAAPADALKSASTEIRKLIK